MPLAGEPPHLTYQPTSVKAKSCGAPAEEWMSTQRLSVGMMAYSSQ